MDTKIEKALKPIEDEQRQALGQISRTVKHINRQGYAFREQVSSMQKLVRDLSEWFEK